jgi:UDP-N-acetyl-alpha-D-muramoyl-L-alanyl-L-glutamate epimerase
VSESAFIVDKPEFDPASAEARFGYRLGEHRFVERLGLPDLPGDAPLDHPVFARLLDLAAVTLGVSYYKLTAPERIEMPGLAFGADERALILDIYENGMGEFYARNDLHRFGKLTVDAGSATGPLPAISLRNRALALIGGGKDSLVSIALLDTAGIEFAPFAVNPKGPIFESVTRLNRIPVFVRRLLDPQMIELSRRPGYYNGHVPATAINSMIAALAAVLYGYNRIVLSNERSASEGNLEFDGRVVNHQHSKSWDFERLLADTLHRVTGGALDYFSLLRPYSEARIAQLFARGTRFDDVFSSCNRNFTVQRNKGPLWCGECPKCHFVFLILAPWMDRGRLLGIFRQNVLDNPANLGSYRELVGLAGQKPWECVGEILEAAASLWRISANPDWTGDAIVAALRPELEAFYGADRLAAAWTDLMRDGGEHLIPGDIAAAVSAHAA